MLSGLFFWSFPVWFLLYSVPSSIAEYDSQKFSAGNARKRYLRYAHSINPKNATDGFPPETHIIYTHMLRRTFVYT